MKQPTPVEVLQTLESKLPYGSKTAIARKLASSQAQQQKWKQNVQSAFRGTASMEITTKVLKQAQKILSKHTVRKVKVIRRITVKQ